MFHTATTSKILAASAALLILPAAAAFAQSSAYGVSANTQTMGHPNGSSNYSNGLPLDNYEYRESDPVGTNWLGVYVDAGARGWAQPGELRVKTDATANMVSQRDGMPSSNPYGFAEVRFWDTATVLSDTLPAGTPVTLVFRNELQVLNLQGTGNFSGTFYGTHTIAGRSSAQQISFSDRDMDFTVSLGDITVNTKVGARFAMSGRLSLSTHARYYSYIGNSVSYSGHSEGELLLKPVLASASGDAYLATDGGATYQVAGN